MFSLVRLLAMQPSGTPTIWASVRRVPPVGDRALSANLSSGKWRAMIEGVRGLEIDVQGELGSAARRDPRRRIDLVRAL